MVHYFKLQLNINVVQRKRKKKKKRTTNIAQQNRKEKKKRTTNVAQVPQAQDPGITITLLWLQPDFSFPLGGLSFLLTFVCQDCETEQAAAFNLLGFSAGRKSLSLQPWRPPESRGL